MKVFANGCWRAVLAVGAILVAATGVSPADTMSYTGTLASPEDTVLIPMVLTSRET